MHANCRTHHYLVFHLYLYLLHTMLKILCYSFQILTIALFEQLLGDYFHHLPTYIYCIVAGTFFQAVSIKHGLRTTDYRLRTGYKTRTKHYGLGIKYGLRYKTRTEHYGLSIKHEEKFYIE